MDIYRKIIVSPIGNLLIESDLIALKAITFTDKIELFSTELPEIIGLAVMQLKEYFNGKRTKFDLQLSPEGTDFQKRVWELVMKVDFGETKSYGDLAVELGSPTFSRAVGNANGSNPIPIIIPCHRIIGSKGKLFGYSGGMERKKWLLLHEQNLSGRMLL